MAYKRLSMDCCSGRINLRITLPPDKNLFSIICPKCCQATIKGLMNGRLYSPDKDAHRGRKLDSIETVPSAWKPEDPNMCECPHCFKPSRMLQTTGDVICDDCGIVTPPQKSMPMPTQSKKRTLDSTMAIVMLAVAAGLAGSMIYMLWKFGTPFAGFLSW